MPTDLLTRWGSNIKEAREAKGWTQGQLAKAINSTQQYVSTLERGGAEPRHSTRIALSHALGVDVYALFPAAVAA